MRFVCQSCQAKYSIPDERVEGKVIRLKCQKCSAEIVVKGPTKTTEPEAKSSTEKSTGKSAKIAPLTRIEDRPAVRLEEDENDNALSADDDDEPRESTRIANLSELENMRAQAAADKSVAAKTKAAPPKEPALPQSTDKREWLVLVNGAQQGPFSLGVLRAKITAGAVQTRAYAWREGMGDWLRLQQLPDFADLAKNAPQTKSEAPQKTETTKQTSDFDAVFGTPPPLESKVSEAKEKRPDLGLELGLDPEPSPELTTGAHELDELANNEGPTRFIAAAQKPAPPKRESTQSFLAAASLADERARQRTILMIMGAIVLIIGAAVLISMLSTTPAKPEPTGPKQASSLPIKATEQLSEEEKARLRDGLLGKKKDEGKEEPDTSAARSAGKKTDNAPRDTKTAEEQKLLNDVYGEASKTAVRIEPPKIRTPEQDLPRGITPEAITKVVESNQRAVKNCLERELKRGGQATGKLEVEFTIAPEGTVSAADIKSTKFKGSDLGGCVVQAVKLWKFPRFSGEPVPVEYPFILSAGQ